MLFGAGAMLLAQEIPASTGAMKRLSLAELMEIQVTSVSRRPERLTEVASAIQVVTGEDMRRSGAANLVEALQLAPNLRVARVNSYGTVITARGFSALFANKLLVMIDGRSVYTPLFAGVFWDVQNPVLEDIDRVEIVSGPGGTLWGANAVNGVINVLTKSAAETQGWYVSAGAGSFLENALAVRYGGSSGRNLHYRFHVQRHERGNTFLPGGAGNTDAWHIAQGGGRMDWSPSSRDTLTLQGDLYDGTEHTSPADSTVRGGNVLARWSRTFSAVSDMRLQVFFDRASRHDIPSTLTDRLSQYDIDFQHRFPLAPQHGMLWGVGARWMQSEVLNSTSFVGFVPNRRDMDRFSGFVQDEISLAPDRWKLTVGTKLEHNEFSGFEIQPSARVAWTPSGQHTIWAALSRAVRVPSRIDVDYHIPAMPIAPGTPGVNGGPDFDSEKVVAWELGWRAQSATGWSVSLATFFNRYDDIYSVEALPGTPTYQIQNGTEGESWGAELSGMWRLSEAWRLRGGYTCFEKDLRPKPGHVFPTELLGNDPKHQFVLQSVADVGGGVQIDLTARYVGKLPAPAMPGYFTCDVRLAWERTPWEISVVGQNLAEARHAEFGQVEIPRSVFGKIVWRW